MRIPVLTGFIFFLMMQTASADLREDLEICATMNERSDVRLTACNSVFESGQQTGEALAETYFFRGQFFVKRNRWPRAIADMSEAIRLKSNFPGAYFFGSSTFEVDSERYGQA